MNESPDFARIRELSDSYYQQQLSRDEYRRQRTEILNKIDKEINDIDAVGQAFDSDGNFVDKVISFFKKTDEEKIL